MRIQVRYFAVVRERLGREDEVLELPAGARVAEALRALAERHDAIAALRPALRAAVNRTFVGDDATLADGDELALIPPVAGGAEARLARLVADRALGQDAVIAAVASQARGALVTFTGAVRGESRGQRVVRLEYEAYPEMAERVLADICDAVEREVPGARLAVEHRTGVLSPGEVAVIIAAAAPHRREAFRACEALLERLKHDAPIWKKEVTEGGAVWVGLGP